MTHDPARRSERASAAIRAYDESGISARRVILRWLALASDIRDRRSEVLFLLESVAGGTRALIGMRRDALALQQEDPAVDEVEHDLRELLSASFDQRRLEHRAIDSSSPITVLEHIMRHDAVHRIDSWPELQRRLHPQDRRCFGLFHPAVPDRPVAFTEIALTIHPPTSVDEILAPDRIEVAVELATTAVFYSISSGDPGLRGIRFGESLIKRARGELQRALPRLSRFVTLSPIPGFRRWLAEVALEAGAPDDLRALHNELERVDPSDADDTALRHAAERYVLSIRRGDGRPADAVARFHLGNGARLERIEVRADLSARGRKQSYGVMACYRYERPSA
jgi:malonyl-CoA decarboxylase